MSVETFDRIGLVVHPQRAVDGALATVREWAARHGADVVQVRPPGSDRVVAPADGVGECDLVIALGGDGTTLAALHEAAPAGRSVLGVACGSLGALTAVTADRLDAALHRVAVGDWEPRMLPAIVADREGGGRLAAVNDIVLVRAGAGQVIAEVDLNGERFIRYGGDGLVAATPLGSSAYTLAAGGPLLAPGSSGIVLTPLAPHGGVCPPLVAPPEARLEVLLDPANGGARVEVDGRIEERLERHRPVRYTLGYEPRFASLVSLGEHEPQLAGLRRRRIILDSPRVLARDDREGGN